MGKVESIIIGEGILEFLTEPLLSRIHHLVDVRFRKLTVIESSRLLRTWIRNGRCLLNELCGHRPYIQEIKGPIGVQIVFMTELIARYGPAVRAFCIKEDLIIPIEQTIAVLIHQLYRQLLQIIDPGIRVFFRQHSSAVSKNPNALNGQIR